MDQPGPSLRELRHEVRNESRGACGERNYGLFLAVMAFPDFNDGFNSSQP